MGIGTASPSTELHIASASPVLTLQDTDSTEPLSTYVSFKDSGGNEHGWMGYGSSSADSLQIANTHDDIILYTGSSGTAAERMRIDSSGKVGIGTTSPNKKLVVNENGSECVAIIKSSDTGTAGLYLGGQTDEIKGGIVFNNSDNSLQLRGYNNAERMRIDSSGNLLLGTTSSPASTNPKTLRYGVGVQAGSISTATPATAGVVTTMLNMAGVTGSSQSGAGMYLVTIVRDGGSYATHFVGIYGVNSSSVVLYEVLHSGGMTMSVSGTRIRANVGSTDTYNCNAIPLSIHK